LKKKIPLREAIKSQQQPATGEMKTAVDFPRQLIAFFLLRRQLLALPTGFRTTCLCRCPTTGFWTIGCWEASNNARPLCPEDSKQNTTFGPISQSRLVVR
jgi:hypothetical protein